MNRLHNSMIVTLLVFGVLWTCGTAGAQDLTTVRMTDRVLVEDTMPIGMNISGDPYWKPPALKRRLALNFEGGYFSFFGVWTDKADTGGRKLAVSKHRFRDMEGHIEAVKETGTVTWLEGEKIWDTARVTDVVQEEGQAYLILDEEVPQNSDSQHTPFYLLQAVDRQDRSRDAIGPLVTGKKNAEAYQIALNDVPPGSYGWRSFRIAADDQRRSDGWALTQAEEMDCSGHWRVSLWARAEAGNPSLKTGIQNTDTPIPVTKRWQKFEKVVEAGDVSGTGFVRLDFAVEGGTVLLDDIVVTKLGFENPTAFTDDFVRMMRDDLNVGIVRQLIWGGWSIDHYLQGLLKRQSLLGRNHGKVPWTITEFYTMCEYIGAAPWHSIPGAVRPEGIKAMMEYLGAPPDVGYGKLRARQGHPRPWTEVFDRIYIQIANEPITFNGNSAHVDTWRSLADVAKDSPYYRDNIKLVASGQDVMSGNWRDWRSGTYYEPVPRVDYIALAPYPLKGLWKEDLRRYDREGEVFEWLAHLAQHEWDTFRWARFGRGAHEAGYGVAAYETNFHATFGDASAEERNRIVTSQGGMIALMHNLLYPMRRYGVKDQCFFTLYQFDFAPGGSFGDKFEGNRVRLWGTVLNNRPGRQRYRPAALGLRVINEVIGGDLVQTIHEGAEPELTVFGRWKDGSGERVSKNYHRMPDGEMGEKTHKAVWSFGFVEGDRRGIILMNHDAEKAHSVRIEFPGGAAGGKAATWTIDNEDPFASNEPEVGEVQVRVEKEELSGFRSGHRTTLGPLSLVAIEWQVK